MLPEQIGLQCGNIDSDLPPEQKQSAAAPYLQQIQELLQQLQELTAAGKG